MLNSPSVIDASNLLSSVGSVSTLVNCSPSLCSASKADGGGDSCSCSVLL